MNAEFVKRLKSQLFSDTPLLGGWLRVWAAQKLAQLHSPASYELLAEALVFSKDAKVRKAAIQAFKQIRTPNQIDAVCRVWERTRHPELGNIIRERDWVADQPPMVRVLTALHTGKLEAITHGRGELAEPLLVLCDDRDPAIAQSAQKCLLNLRGRHIVDAVCALWAEQRTPRLEQILLQAGYTAREPLAVRVLTLLKQGQSAELVNGGEEIAPALAAACLDREAAIAAAAQAVVKSLVNLQAQQAACQMVLEQDNPSLIQAVLEAGYEPENSSQRAAFYFLTGQWARYEDLDFDHQILRTYFESSEAGLRERITRQVRLSGRADFLAIIAGRDFQGRLERMSIGELDTLLQILIEHRNWGKLWGMVFRLPLRWSLQAVQILAAQGWQPEREDEREILQRLASLANPQMQQASQSMEEYLPPAVLRARGRALHGRINDLAFSPHRPLLGLATSQRKVILWDYQTGQAAQKIGGLAHSVGEITFTDQDCPVFAERSTGEAPCSVYAWLDERLTLVFTQRSSITALEAVQGNQALVTLRNQGTARLDLARMTAPLERRHDFWARAACIAPDQKQAALMHNGIALIDLENLQVQKKTTTWDQVVRSASFMPDSEEVIAGKYNGEVVRLSGAFLQNRTLMATRHTGWVEGMAVLRKHPVLITAGAEGMILFTRLSRDEVFGKLGKVGEQITSLHISPDEQFMAVGYADATIGLWDLRALDLPKLFQQPFDSASPGQLAALSALAKSDGMPEAARAAIQFSVLVLQHRFRYDIEVDTAVEIKPGEFDIEIADA